MLFDINFFSHYRAIAECMRDLGAHARIDFETLNLLIRGRGRQVELLPQFICRREHGMAYTPGLSPEARGFIGWRPYFNRVWPLGADKLAFKRFCEDNALRTPKYYLQPAALECAVIVKRTRSSFAMGMTGPVSLAQLAALNHPVSPGEYFEEFIEGEIAKIWYWNETPVALEVLAMPAVIGDGRSTIRKLIETDRTFFSMHGELTFDVAAALAEFQGMTLDSIAPEGRRVLTDFRYQSPLHPASWEKQNALQSYAGRTSMKQIEAAGKPFWSAIPETIRPDTLYTIDAIIDQRDDVWFLEMNCNPMVHVDAYRPMLLSALTGSRVRRAGATQAPLPSVAKA
jgi:hypothetical protein